MSKYQKFVILLACIIIVGMCVYPPMYGKKTSYYLTTSRQSKSYTSTHFVGYHFFFKPPKEYDNCRIDLERLSVQIIAVLAVGVGLFVIGPKRKHEKET